MWKPDESPASAAQRSTGDRSARFDALLRLANHADSEPEEGEEEIGRAATFMGAFELGVHFALRHPKEARELVDEVGRLAHHTNPDHIAMARDIVDGLAQYPTTTIGAMVHWDA